VVPSWINLTSAGYRRGMSILSKLTKSGIAAKAISEARKPENQAKAKAAVQKLKDRRKPRPQAR
jgi:hypothetical protein